MLREGERLDDLQLNGLKLIQNPDGFCFGCDGVELANFVTGGVKDYAYDLGAGTGIISVLLAAKKKIKVCAVEIQENCCDMLCRSVALNGLDDFIEVLNTPMQNLKNLREGGRAEIVVCNPPYRKISTGETQSTDAVMRSRHEIDVTFKEVASTAGYLLKNGGRFFTINQTERLGEVICECQKHKLMPKVLQILTPSNNKPPHLFMLKCVKDAKDGLDVLPQRVIDTNV